jgi:transcriptional regulator with XRE-family HTH domain
VTVSGVDVCIGRALREARERRGLSAAELGARLGTTAARIRAWESGDERAGAATLFRLSDALQTPLSALFHRLSDRDRAAR